MRNDSGWLKKPKSLWPVTHKLDPEKKKKTSSVFKQSFSVTSRYLISTVRSVRWVGQQVNKSDLCDVLKIACKNSNGFPYLSPLAAGRERICAAHLRIFFIPGPFFFSLPALTEGGDRSGVEPVSVSAGSLSTWSCCHLYAPRHHLYLLCCQSCWQQLRMFSEERPTWNSGLFGGSWLDLCKRCLT